MLGLGAVAELPIAALRDEDSDANATPYSEVYEAPSAERVYLVEISPYQPSSS